MLDSIKAISIRTITAALFVTALLQSVDLQTAAAQKQVAIVSLRSVNDVLKDIKPGFTNTGNEETFLQLSGMTEGASGAIDLSKPVGIVAYLQDGQPGGLAFAGLVVEDGESSFGGLLAMAKLVLGEPKEHPGGIYEFKTPGGPDAGGPDAGGDDPFGFLPSQQHYVAFGDDPFGAPEDSHGQEHGEVHGARALNPLQGIEPPESFFITEKNGNVYVATSAKFLAALPDDPQTLVNGLAAKHDFAMEVSLTNLPADIHDMMKGAFVESVLDSASQNGESPLTREQLEQWANDAESVYYTTDIEATGEIKTTLGLTIVADSKTEAWFGKLKDSKTHLAGFLKVPAALNFTVTSPLSDETAAKILKTIPEAGEDAILGKYQTMVLTVFKQMLNAETFDAGFTTIIEEGSSFFAIGGRVSDPESLVATYRELYTQLQADPTLEFVGDPKITFAKAGEKNFRLVTQAAKLKGESGTAEELFGDTVDIVMARGEDIFIIGAGSDGAKRVTAIIEASVDKIGAQAAPFNLSVSLNQFLAFANEPIDPAMSAVLEKAGDNDRMLFTFAPHAKGNGGQLELTLDPWALDLLAVGISEEAQGGTNAGASGTVTMGGVPLKDGTISFVPAEGETISGPIFEDGTFDLVVPPGDYSVAITSAKVAIPAKYAPGTSALSARIIDGSNVFDFNLQP